MLPFDIPYRWLLIAVFVTDLSISVYYRRKAKKQTGGINRSREGYLALLGRLAIALPLYGSLIAYMVNPGWVVWGLIEPPEGVRMAGFAVLLATVPFTFWVMSTIGENISETVLTKERHRLVTHGPYRWIRHPLYTDGLMLFVGATMLSGNWITGLWTLAALLAVRLVIIPNEEQNLIQRFGEEYRRYQAGTGALLPRFGKR